MARVVAGAHHTIDRLAETAAPHVERLREADLGDEWAKSLRETVRENPLTALAVAVAAGMVLARVTR